MIDLSKGDTGLIIRECRARGVLRNQCAYVLATACWETARTMRPVREYGGEAYLRQKPYYPYVGMGYVQLTWESNYRRASEELGVDFVAQPVKLLEAKHAVKILVIGMLEGWFTGKKLSDYVTLQKSDFLNARRIVNGVDRKVEIAAFATQYDQALTAVGYGVADDGPKTEPPRSGECVSPDHRPPGVSGRYQTIWTTLAALVGRFFYRR